MISFFRKKQAEYGKSMDFEGNINHIKFDLRSIMTVVPENHIKPLINFYLKNSDKKTLRDFTQKYDEYYSSLIDYAENRRAVQALKRKTLERVNEQ